MRHVPSLAVEYNESAGAFDNIGVGDKRTNLISRLRGDDPLRPVPDPSPLQTVIDTKRRGADDARDISSELGEKHARGRPREATGLSPNRAEPAPIRGAQARASELSEGGLNHEHAAS